MVLVRDVTGRTQTAPAATVHPASARSAVTEGVAGESQEMSMSNNRSGGKDASTETIATPPGPIDTRPRREIGTLRELWRFKDYARPERGPLLAGVAMRGLELAADL